MAALRGLGQPQYADAIFPGFPILIDLDAAIRLERYHVNERISVRQERRRAVNEVVKVGSNARGFGRAVVALDDRRKNWRHSLSPPSHRTRASATCPLALGSDGADLSAPSYLRMVLSSTFNVSATWRRLTRFFGSSKQLLRYRNDWSRWSPLAWGRESKQLLPYANGWGQFDLPPRGALPSL